MTGALPAEVRAVLEQARLVSQWANSPTGPHAVLNAELLDLRHAVEALDAAAPAAQSDFAAMQWADAGVLLLPAGRSAHLEAGWFVGSGRPLYIVLDPYEFRGGEDQTSNTELMYLLAAGIFAGLDGLLGALAHPDVG